MASSSSDLDLISGKDASLPSESSSRPRKEQHRFWPERNIILLKEVISIEPYAAHRGQVTERWEKVAANYNKGVGIDGAINAERARKHFDKLLKEFKSQEATPLRASGTDEQYDEQDQLLADVKDRIGQYHEASLREAEATRKKVTILYFISHINCFVHFI